MCHETRDISSLESNMSVVAMVRPFTQISICEWPCPSAKSISKTSINPFIMLYSGIPCLLLALTISISNAEQPFAPEGDAVLTQLYCKAPCNNQAILQGTTFWLSCPNNAGQYVQTSLDLNQCFIAHDYELYVCPYRNRRLSCNLLTLFLLGSR